MKVITISTALLATASAGSLRAQDNAAVHASSRGTAVMGTTLASDPRWTLIFRSTLVSNNAGTTSHASGDFSTSDPEGSPAGNGEYRTGMTADEMDVLGVTGIMVKNGDDYVKIFDQGRYDAQGFADPGTDCNARGKSLGNDLYWHGGAGGCYGSPHMGLSYKTKGDVHMNCNSGVVSGGIKSHWERDLAKSSDFTHFGHFHKWGRNTGAYSFGQHCGNDEEGGETFSYWVMLEGTAPPSKWMSARYGRSYWNNGDARGDGGFGAAAHNAYKPVANLQCCSKDGSEADRKPFGNCNVDASGKTWDGGMPWSNANDICEAAGQRLCTDTEVLSGIGEYTGCNFDHHYVWTSTPWDQVPEDARKMDE